MAVTIPATFQRPATSKALGIVEYIIIVPIATLFLTVIGSLLIQLVLHGFGLRGETAVVVVLLTFLTAFFGVTWFAVTDYRRRACAVLEVHHDHLVLGSADRRQVIPFGEVTSIDLVWTRVGMACVLHGRAGQVVELPKQIAPYWRVKEALEVTLIPHLAQTVTGRLAGGEVICLRDSRVESLLRIMRGIANLAVAIGATIAFHSGLAGRLFRKGRLRIGQGKRGLRGGFCLRSEGVCPTNGPIENQIAWSEIAEIRRDDSGITVEQAGGRRLSVSSLSDNFWPIALWMEHVHALT